MSDTLPIESNPTPSLPPLTPEPLSKIMTILVILSGVIALILFGILIYIHFKKPTNQGSSPSSPENQNVSLQFTPITEFPKMNVINTLVKPALPATPFGINDLTNVANFEKANKVAFSDTQKEALNSQHFVITSNKDHFYADDPTQTTGRVDDWVDLYNKIGGDYFTRAPENSVFISSDFLLHVYHRLLEKELEFTEQHTFYPKLKAMTNSLFSASVQKYQQANDPAEKESYSRLIAYFALPKALLDSNPDDQLSQLEDTQSDTPENITAQLTALKSQMPSDAYQNAVQELKLVLDANSPTDSPIFQKVLQQEVSGDGVSFTEDYTQYQPRSHYVKNAFLRSYFRAMMWYGRTNFYVSSPSLTRDAIHISQLLAQTQNEQNWADIYLPTAFLVGKSDDLNYQEYQAALAKLQVTQLNADTITHIQNELLTQHKPQIMSAIVGGEGVLNQTKVELQNKTQGFRFMGQRFTPDAFIFTTLTQGDEKPDPQTGQRLPSSTSGLFVMSVLGNSTANALTNDWITKNAPGSNQVLPQRVSALQNQFQKLSIDQWTQNIYWSWLYTLTALFPDFSSMNGYPLFMKNPAWQRKNLQAALGSWTELKHDTLLYAKQSYAEKGGGGDITPPPVPKGYVEPNVEFFDRLLALVDMSNRGLKDRGLLDAEFEGRTKHFVDSLQFFRKIAVQELQNEKISDDDFERLRSEGALFESVVQPLPTEEWTEEHARAALIADVHTDAQKSEILYEADGVPNYVYVAVKDQNGTRLTKGLVYSYYEFTAPLGQRLTDQDWRKWNYSTDTSHLPALPDWSATLVK